jgi:hypothetical protein
MLRTLTVPRSRHRSVRAPRDPLASLPPSRSNMRDTTPRPGRLTPRRCCWIQEGDWVLITGVRK